MKASIHPQGSSQVGPNYCSPRQKFQGPEQRFCAPAARHFAQSLADRSSKPWPSPLAAPATLSVSTRAMRSNVARPQRPHAGLMEGARSLARSSLSLPRGAPAILQRREGEIASVASTSRAPLAYGASSHHRPHSAGEQMSGSTSVEAAPVIECAGAAALVNQPSPLPRTPMDDAPPSSALETWTIRPKAHAATPPDQRAGRFLRLLSRNRELSRRMAAKNPSTMGFWGGFWGTRGGPVTGCDREVEDSRSRPGRGSGRYARQLPSQAVQNSPFYQFTYSWRRCLCQLWSSGEPLGFRYYRNRLRGGCRASNASRNDASPPTD